MEQPEIFCRARPDAIPTRYLCAPVCGAVIGQSLEDLAGLFATFHGEEEEPPRLVLPQDSSASHAFIVFHKAEQAEAALQALNGHPCGVSSYKLVLRYADVKRSKMSTPTPQPALRTSEALGIPGLHLLLDFVSEGEEAALLAGVDSSHWVELAKRRVQHYGYQFDYAVQHQLSDTTRSVDSTAHLGLLPPFVQDVVLHIEALPQVNMQLDQLTINNYEPGVGLSAHIDTHSAFEGAIVSLSLSGPTVMELRRGDDRRALALPPRSLLLLTGESRYAWQHYIPHRKTDLVLGVLPEASLPVESSASHQPVLLASAPAQPLAAWVPRSPRRVSLTFRRVRHANSACSCPFPQYCDSQGAIPPPTRLALLQQQREEESKVQQRHGTTTGCGVPTTPTPTTALQRGFTPVAKQQAGQQETAQLQGAPDGSASACSTGLHRCTAEAVAGAAAATAAATAAAGTPIPSTAVCPPAPPGLLSPLRHPSPANASEAAAEALELELVHRVYDAIAPHFSATRFSIWPKVRSFIDSLPAGTLLADVGCGNGKYFGVRRDITVLGCDRSAGLAQVAAERLQPSTSCLPAPANAPLPRLRADVFVADALALPFRPASCDGALCIAVLHHLSSPVRRRRLIAQLGRLLRRGGRALVTVWASEQEDPKKTIHKWSRMEAVGPEVAIGGAKDNASITDKDALAGASYEGSNAMAPDRLAPLPRMPSTDRASCYASATGRTPCSARGNGGTSSFAGGDYLVPWHMPMHRPEANGLRQRAAARHVADNLGSGWCATAQAAVPQTVASGTGSSSTAAATTEGTSTGVEDGGNLSKAEMRQGRLARQRAARAAFKATTDISAVAQSSHDPTNGKECSASGASATAGSAGAGTTRGMPLGCGSGGHPADPQVDDAKGALVYQRYYHLFDEGELDALLDGLCVRDAVPSASDGADASPTPLSKAASCVAASSDRPVAATDNDDRLVVVESFYDHSNWCIVFERQAPQPVLTTEQCTP